MKKFLLVLAGLFLFASFSFAQNITLHQGWNFYGAQENQITMNQFDNENIVGLMKYIGNGLNFDLSPQNWAVWARDENLMSTLEEAGWQKLYTIYQGESFVVYSTGNTNLNIHGYCPANYIPIVTESYNYQTGGFSVISANGVYSNLNQAPLGGDVRSYYFDGYTFVVDAPNTGGISTFYVYKTGFNNFSGNSNNQLIANYNIQRQNPHSIAFKSLNKAYLTTYFDNSILIFNPLTGEELGSIDLTPYLYVADNGSKNSYVGAEHMVIYKNKLFVSLDRARTFYGDAQPDKSMIIVINTDTDQIENSILVNYSPRSLQIYNDKLYFLSMGDYSNPIGTIYRIDLSSMSIDPNFKISPIINSDNTTEFIKNFEITPDGEVYLVTNGGWNSPYNVYKILNINVYNDSAKIGLLTQPVYSASSYISDIDYICGYIVLADRGKADIDYTTKEVKEIIEPGSLVFIDSSGNIYKIYDTTLGYPPYKIGTDYNY